MCVGIVGVGFGVVVTLLLYGFVGCFVWFGGEEPEILFGSLQGIGGGVETIPVAGAFVGVFGGNAAVGVVEVVAGVFAYLFIQFFAWVVEIAGLKGAF